MANFKKMMEAAALCKQHIDMNLTPSDHLGGRAHFGSYEEVTERMRRERKVVGSSFYGHLSEEALFRLLQESVEIDAVSLETNVVGYDKATGLSRVFGDLIIEPLDEEENPVSTGFAYYFNKADRTYSGPKACRRIMIYLAWEEYADGRICEELFQIRSIFPIR